MQSLGFTLAQVCIGYGVVMVVVVNVFEFLRGAMRSD